MSYWKTATFGWIAFVVAAVVVGGAAGATEMKSWTIANGESRQAEQILDEANFNVPARESVLVQSAWATFDDDVFSSAVANVVQRWSGQDDVENIVSQVEHPHAGLVSRHAALVQFDVRARPRTRKTGSRRCSPRSTTRSPCT